MQKLVIGMPTCKARNGFTLIEILIVIVIIGITVNFAMLSFGDFGQRRKIINAAEHFAYFISLVKKEAVLTNQTLAIQIKKDNYSVLKFNNNKWQAIPKDIYKNQKLPNGATITTLGKKNNQKPKLIIINQIGIITQFKLNFGNNQDKVIAVVSCDRSGNIKVQKNAKE